MLLTIKNRLVDAVMICVVFVMITGLALVLGMSDDPHD